MSSIYSSQVGQRDVVGSAQVGRGDAEPPSIGINLRDTQASQVARLEAPGTADLRDTQVSQTVRLESPSSPDLRDTQASQVARLEGPSSPGVRDTQASQTVRLEAGLLSLRDTQASQVVRLEAPPPVVKFLEGAQALFTPVPIPARVAFREGAKAQFAPVFLNGTRFKEGAHAEFNGVNPRSRVTFKEKASAVFAPTAQAFSLVSMLEGAQAYFWVRSGQAAPCVFDNGVFADDPQRNFVF